MSIISFFKLLVEEDSGYNGVAFDPRTDDEKAKDWEHAEIAGGNVVSWIEKKPTEWKSYTPRYQYSSLSCVGQSMAKAMEIIGIHGSEVESAHPIYRSRSNYPSGGMWLQNAGDIGKNIGTTTEKLSKSQNLSESQMNRAITVATPDKVAGYVTIGNPTNIDSIAQAIESYGQCLIITHCNRNEWLQKIPTYTGATPVDFGHCVTGVDYITYKGKKAIIIEDSTGNTSTYDGKQQRIVTEDFFKSGRIDGAMYLLPRADTPKPPSYQFTKLLKYGSTGKEVTSLQDCLKSLGIFPAATVSTGNFLTITQKAVKDFQKMQNITPDGIVGPVTRTKLNGLFNK